jgi:hypothetical protein
VVGHMMEAKQQALLSGIDEAWRSLPLRISGSRFSSCCGVPTALVRSPDGQFVLHDCSKCGSSTPVTESEFYSLRVWVACPTCKRPMKSSVLVNKGFCYECGSCTLTLRLADLLPSWVDIA